MEERVMKRMKLLATSLLALTLGPVGFVAQAQQEPLIAQGNAADQPSQVAMDQHTAASGPTDSPADAASDSVSQARKEHAAGRYDAARAHLKSAAQFFDKVALSEGKFAEDASHTLAQESRDIERKIGAAADKGDKAFGSALAAIGERAEAFAKFVRTAGTVEGKHKSAAKVYLMHANLHLAYARSYQLNLNQPSTARTELQRVEDYLNKAMAQTSGPDKRIQHLITTVDGMMAHIDKKQTPADPAATGARYRALETKIESLSI
jgi:hypothetical protein